MLERATAKSPGGGGRDHPLKLGLEAGSLPALALLRSLKRPSMKWLETAFAEDVGGALLAFRAGRHRAYLSDMGAIGFRSPAPSASSYGVANGSNRDPKAAIGSGKTCRDPPSSISTPKDAADAPPGACSEKTSADRLLDASSPEKSFAASIG
jgi:hypothetical protein